MLLLPLAHAAFPDSVWSDPGQSHRPRASMAPAAPALPSSRQQFASPACSLPVSFDTSLPFYAILSVEEACAAWSAFATFGFLAWVLSSRRTMACSTSHDSAEPAIYPNPVISFFSDSPASFERRIGV